MKSDLSEFSGLVQELDNTFSTSSSPPARPASKAPHPLLNTPIYNRKAPAYLRQKEQPYHRAVLELSAQGFTAVEISETLGISRVTAQDILLQPHLEAPLRAGIHENFGPDQQVVEVIKENVVNAINLLAEQINDKTAPRKDRRDAALALLERRYGKAAQPITNTNVIDLNSLPDSELVKAIKEN